MKITKINIKNFRLLKEVEIDLEDELSIIVGKNNTGKTSVLEILNKFLSNSNPSFNIEDFNSFCFSLKNINDFRAKCLTVENSEELLIKDILESFSIELKLTISYGENDEILNLNPFFLSLDPRNRNIAIIFKYRIQDNKMKDFISLLKEKEEEDNKSFFKKSQEYFKTYHFSQENNKIAEVDFGVILNLINFKFIRASRGIKEENSNSISSLAKEYYTKIKKNNEEKYDFSSFEEATNETNKILTEQYQTFFENFFKSMNEFNFQSINNKNNLNIKSDVKYESLINDNTSIFYQEEQDSVALPESHNGLGYTNLLYLCLKIKTYCDEFKLENNSINLLFIEEPEAHMHPQMQHIFIKHIKDFIKNNSTLNIQELITTHSPYILLDANFNDLKYFNLDQNNNLNIKNCSQLQEDEKSNIIFVKKYLTINKFEMFFADYIIMVEGATEKILLPYFMQQIDKELGGKNISIIEVGGAYAHKFKAFIEFLNIKTLILTDIDFSESGEEKSIIEFNDNAKNKTTTNYTLTALTEKDKIDDILNFQTNQINPIYRVFTQTTQPDNNNILLLPRSFEEDFILSNYDFFKKNYNNFSDFKTDKKENIKKEINNLFKENEEYINSIDYVKKIKKEIDSKTNFALDILFSINEENNNYNIPKYIKDGIKWLI